MSCSSGGRSFQLRPSDAASSTAGVHASAEICRPSERSASSGSTCSLRATLTTANSRSPSSWKRSLGRVGGLELRRARRAPTAADPRSRGSQSRWRRRAAGPCGRTAADGRFSGTSPNTPGSRPGSLCLICVPVAQHLAGRRGLHLAEHVRVAADQLLGDVLGDPAQIARRRAPRAAATGSGPGTGRRRARRAAWRRRPGWPRRPARRPPRPCAGRSCARSARGPRDTPGAAGG